LSSLTPASLLTSAYSVIGDVKSGINETTEEAIDALASAIAGGQSGSNRKGCNEK
jgi:hypothetical protein